MSATKYFKGYMFVTVAGILWGILGLLGKTLASYNLSSYDIAFYRLFVGFMLLFLYLVIKDYKLLLIDKKGLAITAIIGFVCQGIFNSSYFTAIEKTTITTAVILLYTAPVFTNILSKFIYKEAFDVYKTVSLILCVAGCFLTATGGDLNSLKINLEGILYGIGAGFTFGLMPILNKKPLEKYSSWTIIFYSFGFGCLFLIPFANPLSIFQVESTINMWVGILSLGLFPTIGSYYFYLNGLSLGIEPSKASIISTIEVVVSVIIAYVVFNESMSFIKLIGVLMVISSVIVVQGNNLFEKQKQKTYAKKYAC